jgi:hypothetical protein
MGKREGTWREGDPEIGQTASGLPQADRFLLVSLSPFLLVSPVSLSPHLPFTPSRRLPVPLLPAPTFFRFCRYNRRYLQQTVLHSKNCLRVGRFPGRCLTARD